MFYYLWYSTVESSLKPSHLLLFVAPCSMSSYIKNDICTVIQFVLFVAPCSMSSYIKNDICSITYGTPRLSLV